jgi:(1->4)-alpha-D-glucan 1-alpha-D-glucosylmutase
MGNSDSTANPEPAAKDVRVPRATYRLQFHSGFTFRDAEALVPYLSSLGVSDVYASPLAQARPGSRHGYDVCDPNVLNPELGGQAEFERLCESLQAHGLGLILDIVPNHLGIGPRLNHWWWDVLEWGANSIFADTFDIDWDPPWPGLRGKVLLPILGGPYGEVLGRGEIGLLRSDEGLEMAYFDHRFPISAKAWSRILAGLVNDAAAQRVAARRKAGSDKRREWAELQAGLERLTAEGNRRGDERDASWKEWKRGFVERVAGSRAMEADLDALLTAWNGTPGDPTSYDELHHLLQLQHYRLAWWRLGICELNYRRFFDVTHLAGLRVDEPEVFLRSHQLVARLWREGQLTGLRIDHPDGLRAPGAYLRRLQQLAVESAPEGESLPETDERGRVMYVTVEKILCPGEKLPADWPVHGTTGYDFLNSVNGVFLPTDQVETFSRIYEGFCGALPVFSEELRLNKWKVLEGSLVAEWDSLARRLQDLVAETREACDYSLPQLKEAVGEVIAAFPVYRTYVEPGEEQLPAAQVAQIDFAVRATTHVNPRIAPSLAGFVGRILKLEWPPAEHPGSARARDWVMRFQQLTGPAMAKGLEDTTFYTYNRLVSLNEVGGHPVHFGVSLEEFHQANRDRLRDWPGSMLATATHDTKRGEDLRARIHVLAELPEAWERALVQFRSLNSEHHQQVQGQRAPSSNDEYLLYQTLVGMGVPDARDLRKGSQFRERVEAYMLKAIREAKVRTSWTEPNPEYEVAVKHFVGRILDPDLSGAFLSVLQRLARQVSWFGRFNSLGQTLLKLTAPGVPDIYQGTEFLDLSLVDPDNRRPVDFGSRQTALKAFEAWAKRGGKVMSERVAGLPAEQDGELAKLWVLWRVLSARRRESRLWLCGDYRALTGGGHLRNHLVVFSRGERQRGFVVVVPRLVASLTGGAEHLPMGEAIWGDTDFELPTEWAGGILENVLTGERLAAEPRLRVAAALRSFPVAFLMWKCAEGGSRE